jgi:hypothetical protein
MKVKKRLFELCQNLLQEVIHMDPETARPYNRILKALHELEKIKKGIKNDENDYTGK